MYTKFFGLNEKPFSITPDPRYLFMSERHGEGLAHLLYGVTDSGGFIQLTGEVGTGKTTLVRTLLGQLPNEVDVALILNPQLTVLEFLQSICKELHVDLPQEKDRPMALVDQLNRHLLDTHANGRRVILLVDEAQNLSHDVLEQLRLLTNLETAKQKLLQIILIGQPELREVLAQNNLRQLAQRVTGRYHLEPLSKEESAKYIDHRMRVAGALGEIFSDAAKLEVYRSSGGIPRVMNVICDRALLGAYSQESRLVDRAIVRKAAKEVAGEPDHASRLNWVAALAGIAAVAVVVIAAVMLPRLLGETDAQATAAPAPAEQAPILVNNTAGTRVDAVQPTTSTTEPLERLLTTGELSGDSERAMSKLLGLWGVDYDAAIGNGCTQAQSQGLSCLWQRGSFSVLRQLDRPAVLTLISNTGLTYEAVLIALSDETAELAFADEVRSFSVEEISDLWFGQYLIVWRPPTGTPASLRPGMRSSSVSWLRNSLAMLEGEDTAESSDPTYFDAELESRLRSFQRQHRLEVDGLAGEKTQILINSLLAQDGAPRLSGDI
ncbi:MAG: AAA family ATPase [Pseudomonadota bacterium]